MTSHEGTEEDERAVMGPFLAAGSTQLKMFPIIKITIIQKNLNFLSSLDF